MADDGITQANSLATEIEDHDVGSEDVLPFNLFDRVSNRTTKLLATSGESRSIEGRHRWFDYKLIEPAFITKVEVQISGYSEFHEFEFRWMDVNGREKSSTGKPVGSEIKFQVNDICRRVSFRPPSVFFSSTEVSSVSVYGIEASAVPMFLDRISEIDEYKDQAIVSIENSIKKAEARIAQADKLEAERAAIQREITQSKSSLARLKRSLDESSRQRGEMAASVTAAEEALSSAKARLIDTDNAQKSAQKSQAEIKSEIAKAKSELKSLQDNINLFPSEIIGFVNQGSTNIKQYIAIALIPITVIVVMFVLLVKGAADLTVVVSKNPSINIEAMMISRVPYVLIATAIITACYKIARVFISEIMKINTQRLSLTKLSIIAKDVSSSAEFGLELQDSEIYKLRTDLKMQLLRDHLKDYLSKDFTVELPSRLFGVFPLGKQKIRGKIEDNSAIHEEKDDI
jgi:Skp family chaperone for outer membrane proteins